MFEQFRGLILYQIFNIWIYTKRILHNISIGFKILFSHIHNSMLMKLIKSQLKLVKLIRS